MLLRMMGVWCKLEHTPPYARCVASVAKNHIHSLLRNFPVNQACDTGVHLICLPQYHEMRATGQIPHRRTTLPNLAAIEIILP